MIHFRNVSLAYSNGITALNDINLRVEKGEFVFVVGSTGSGKSSLLKLASRQELPTRGEVFVDGEDVTRIPDREVWRLRRKVAVVFQEYLLLQSRTVWENVAFALRVTGGTGRQIRRRVPEFLDLVGLAGRADSYPWQLSGGEKQRTAIARALAPDPTILLADEPTGNLDPDASWGIVQLLERINLRGATVVMATHDSNVVDQMRRRVVALAKGAITRDELKAAYNADPVKS